jgi:hypothetical protein
MAGAMSHNEPKGAAMSANEVKPSAIDVLALARQAGLDKAVTEFPEDVAAAAEAAAQAQRACAGGGQSTDEPWPPMRARTTS